MGSSFQKVMLEFVSPLYDRAVAEMAFPHLKNRAYFELIESRGL